MIYIYIYISYNYIIYIPHIRMTDIYGLMMIPRCRTRAKLSGNILQRRCLRPTPQLQRRPKKPQRRWSKESWRLMGLPSVRFTSKMGRQFLMVTVWESHPPIFLLVQCGQQVSADQPKPKDFVGNSIEGLCIRLILDLSFVSICKYL